MATCGKLSVEPTVPSFTITPGTGQVTVTIDGESGVDNYVVYKQENASSWTAGGSRSGDGDITVTGLSNGVRYIFTVYSQFKTGPISSYAPTQSVLLSEASEDSAGGFNDTLIDTADDFLDAFDAEDIKYYPKGGGVREIRAIVDRQGVAALGDAPHGKSHLLNITVKNDDTEGISSSEVDTGGDEVELQVRLSESVKRRRITKVISQDPGMMQLEVR